MSLIRQNQFEEKRDLEEVRNVLKTSPGFNKMVKKKFNFFFTHEKNDNDPYWFCVLT